MSRKAQCSCGGLKVILQGEPSMVVTCNCLKCQKRTGSVFGAGAYFDNEQVIEKKR